MTYFSSLPTLLAAAALTAFGTASFADDMTKTTHGDVVAMDHDMHGMVAGLPDGLELGHPVILVAGKAAKSVAGFLVIENTSDADEYLVGADADFARTVQLHRHIIEDGIAKMREVEGGFEIPAGGMHELMRGADHIMIMGLERVPAVGEKVMLTLTFENAGEVSVPFTVLDAASAGELDHGDMDHGDMDHDITKMSQ